MIASEYSELWKSLISSRPGWPFGYHYCLFLTHYPPIFSLLLLPNTRLYVGEARRKMYCSPLATEIVSWFSLGGLVLYIGYGQRTKSKPTKILLLDVLGGKRGDIVYSKTLRSLTVFLNLKSLKHVFIPCKWKIPSKSKLLEDEMEASVSFSHYIRMFTKNTWVSAWNMTVTCSHLGRLWPVGTSKHQWQGLTSEFQVLTVL